VRNATLQPGFPYLWVQYRYGTGELDAGQRVREYRKYAVGLTPGGREYDVTRLEFSPTVVAGEWLQLIEGANGEDKSVYQSQYPLWRLGARYTGWAALSGEPYLASALEAWSWARDPFLLIYRYQPVYAETPDGPWGYGLLAVGVFDPRSRTLRILSHEGLVEVYDTGSYPHRVDAEWLGYGIDWVRGTLRCDFPPLTGDMAIWGPMEVPGLSLDDTTPAGMPFYDLPLSGYWQNRLGGEPLSQFLVEGSVRVRIDVDGDFQPDRTLTEVACTPRDYTDEFQVGLDEEATGGLDPLGPTYGWIRVPEHLATSDPSAGVRATDIPYYYIDFRWRSNGIWVDGEEHTDKISAYYRTAAVLDISLGVTKAGMSVGTEQIAQAVTMTRRVKLRNALREIRYAEE
jgi:hypothetical protein